VTRQEKQHESFTRDLLLALITKMPALYLSVFEQPAGQDLFQAGLLSSKLQKKERRKK